ncbi:protein FAM156A/FAM156B isoform X4 [Cavia porcellus]|uniref:protein FAM156A/FAM156B isoform X4 n=1 Tax=Cavia porcellus TaxID=10141 RepID=UPI002FE15F3E
MRAPLGDLNPFLTSSASQCFLLWGKEAARLRVDGETCTGERMRPGRIQLICGRPKIIEHLCAKDWTVLTDLLLIWLQHRLLFPWHHRRKFETAYLMSECAVQLYRGSRPRGGVGSTFQEAHAQTCGSNVSETMPL